MVFIYPTYYPSPFCFTMSHKPLELQFLLRPVDSFDASVFASSAVVASPTAYCSAAQLRQNHKPNFSKSRPRHRRPKPAHAQHNPSVSFVDSPIASTRRHQSGWCQLSWLFHHLGVFANTHTQKLPHVQDAETRRRRIIGPLPHQGLPHQGRMENR